ncbi:UNVERIFIED_CONTAM: tRNA(Ile)-lysidine synthase [Brevibacillus sp. OAP136]
MLRSVQKQLETEQLLAPGETIVIGVSGGVDSMVLLHLLHSLNVMHQHGWKLHAVHLNHCFRGEEARQDAAYVKSFCEELSIHVHLFEKDVPAYMDETGLGAQEASRNLRYELYEQVARNVKATKVAVAHHADDQVETILYRMLRGTSASGFFGMPMRRRLFEDVELIRPLLPFYKEQLISYSNQVGLVPREDSSNQSRKYQRNKLRLDVLPMFDSINPRYREHILQLANTIRQEDTYLMEKSREALAQVAETWEPNRIVVSLNKFQSCDLALQRRMITLILSYLSSRIEWSSQHVEAVLRVGIGENPSAVYYLPNKLAVKRVYNQLHFSEGSLLLEQHTGPFRYDLDKPGVTFIKESGLEFRLSIQSSIEALPRLGKCTALFDLDRLPGALAVRNRQNGDRISLLGSAGSTKLKEAMIDAKVPRHLRDRLPVVVSGDEIIWVPGVRRSSVAVVDGNTTRVLQVEVEYGEEWQEVFE